MSHPPAMMVDVLGADDPDRGFQRTPTLRP